MSKLLLVIACGFVANAPVAAQGVRIVDAVGDKVFTNIQAAVNAAHDGDVLLVAAGTYLGFTLNGKGVSIIARTGDTVNINGIVRVLGIPAQSDAWLVGVSVLPPYGQYGSMALELDSNLGAVRIAHCSFTGVGALNAAARVTQSEDVAFMSCNLQGGNGAPHQELGDGGNGLAVGTSSVSVFDCQLAGGKGSDWAYDYCGWGGDGTKLSVAGEMFAAGTTFRGGKGGDATNPYGSGYPVAGNGGSALRLGAGSAAALLDNQYFPGPGGWCYGPGNCIPGGNGGTIIGPGSAVHHTGTARRFASDRILSDAKSLTISVTGSAGDRIYAIPGTSAAHVASNAPPGVWLIDRVPFMAGQPLGTLPPAGNSTFAYPLPATPPGAAGQRLWLQGYVIDAQRTPHLANPMHVLTLARGSTPDCNGNGINDFVDVVENKNLDLNNNLIPDSCEP